MSLGIRIATIAHRKQRYKTVGDWLINDPERMTVLVSEMPDWRHEFLVGVHELIEAALCHHRGISEEAVTEFDKAYIGAGEPGDDPRAPYHAQHGQATKLEELLAVMLDVDWGEYEAALEKLDEDQPNAG